MRRIISILVVLVFVLGAVPTVNAQGGTLGDVNWTVENGQLTVTGSGGIANFRAYQNAAPWSDFISTVTKITVGEGITYIGSYAFAGFVNVTEIELPSTLEYIAFYAFNKCCSLTSVNLPEGLKYIGDGAFRECYNLKNAALPDSLESIGGDAFYDCHAIENINVPDSVTYLGDAFWYCKNLKTISIGKNANIVFNNFSAIGCEKLESINVDEENLLLASADGVLFDRAKTTLIKYPAAKNGSEYYVPESVKTISRGAFEKNRNLKNIVIGGTIENVKDYAFDGCNELRNIVFVKEPRFKELKGHTVSTCPQMKEFIIPSSVESIESYAFSLNSELESVVIPASVKKIDTNRPFFRCENLKDIYYMGTKSEWDSIEFKGDEPLHNTAVIHFADEKTNEITIRVNGGKITTDAPAYIKAGRTMVPLRAIFEALGAAVSWDDATKTVTGARAGEKITLTIGDNKLYKNGEKIILDTPAEINMGRTMVPVRAVSEAFGAAVLWDDAYKTVRIIL